MGVIGPSVAWILEGGGGKLTPTHPQSKLALRKSSQNRDQSSLKWRTSGHQFGGDSIYHEG